MMNNIHKILFFLFVGLCSATVGVWTADRDPPNVVFNREVVNPIVPPGGELLIRFSVNRIKHCETRVDRRVIDSAGKQTIMEPITIANRLFPLGFYEPYTLVVPIPISASEGRARYQYASSWVCNPIHNLFPVRSDPSYVEFMILGSPVPTQKVTPIQ